MPSLRRITAAAMVGVAAFASSGTAQDACAPPIKSLLARHTRNWSRIYVIPMIANASGYNTGVASVLSARPGYNAQPAFSRDGKGVYYSWRPDSSQADIWYKDLGTGRERAVTCTSEEEYSPATMPGRDAISVVCVENDSVRRLWEFSPGTSPSGAGVGRALLPAITSIAYYTWVDSITVAAYLVDSSAAGGSSLYIGNVRTGQMERISTNVGSALARVPGRRAVGFVSLQPDQRGRVMMFDLDSHALSPVAELPVGATDFAWLPDRSVLAPAGHQLLRWTPSSRRWEPFSDLGDIARNGILHVVSNTDLDPKGRWLAVVVRVQ
jgi:hypothetical protein